MDASALGWLTVRALNEQRWAEGRGEAVAVAEARGVHGAASGRVGGEEGCVVGVVEEEEEKEEEEEAAQGFLLSFFFLPAQLALGALNIISMPSSWFDSGHIFSRLSWWLLGRPLASGSHLLGVGCC